jgi:peptidoglycan/LPS O-acetylase OafA/YrhL
MRQNSANLDLLRSIAVFAVMIDHLVPTLAYHGVDVPLWFLLFTEHIGQAGVLAFFVHTSLVLMYSLERLATQPGGSLTARFYVRRFFRIYPLAIACVLGVLAFGVPDATWREPIPVTSEEIAANLLLVQNFVSGHSVLVPLWSLPYEVEMYLVLPALYFIARRVNGVGWLCTLLAACSIGGYLIGQRYDGHMNLAAYIPCFLSGVLCYALRERIRPVLPVWAWWIFLATIISAFCLTQLGADKPAYWIGWIYCLIIGLAINAFDDSRRPLLNQVALKVATYSYGLYLLHVPVLYVVYSLWDPATVWLGVLVYFVLTAILAVLAFRLLEAPMMNLGRRLTEGTRSLPVVDT